MTKFATFIIMIFLFVLTPIAILAQSGCATVIDSAQIKYEENLPALPATFEKLNKVLHIHFYIVKRDVTGTNFTTSKIIDAIDFVNLAFEPSGISFALIDTTIIENYQLYNVQKGKTETNLVAQYNQKNVINVYLVDYLRNEDNKTVCGYTYFPSAQKDFIMLRKGCFSEQLLLKQMGHLLNLYHTHETVFGNEQANGEECNTTGDRCCDTPADPGLEDLVSNCKYTGKGKDINNDYYAPTVTNYMSDSPVNCQCKFTEEQLKRVIQCIKGTKSYLY